MAPVGSQHFVNRWTQAATLVTVASGWLVPEDVLTTSRFWFWTASSGFAVWLTAGLYVVERSSHRWALPTYFFVASASLLGLLGLTRGWGWMMGLPLLSHVVLFVSWRWAIGWGVSMLVVVLVRVPVQDSYLLVRVAASVTAASLFVIAFSVVARRELEWRVRSEQLSQSLGLANQQLRAHATEVAELSAMRERNRVAREVHDGLGHYLTTIHVQLEAARALLDKDANRARQGLERAQLLAKQGLQDVRESVSLLRSATPNESRPLEATLAELVEQDGEEAGTFTVALDVNGETRRVSDTVQHVLRRVLQEALTNVRRHSEAKRVHVQLAFEPEHVVLAVENDGVAHVPTAVGDAENTGYGLIGIRERLHLLGGKATFGATADGTFRVTVMVPV